MGRRPLRRTPTIKDPEIQAFMGMLFLVIAILFALSLFVDSLLLDIIRTNLGIGVLVFAVVFLAVGLRLLGTKSDFNNTRVIFSMLLFGAIFLIWIHLFVPGEEALQVAEAGEYGGMIGYRLSRWFYNTFSRLGGIALLTPFLVLSLGSALSLSPKETGQAVIKLFQFIGAGLKWFAENTQKAFNWLLGKKEDVDVDVKVPEEEVVKMVSDLSESGVDEFSEEEPTPGKEPKQEEPTQLGPATSTPAVVSGTTDSEGKFKQLYPNWKLPSLDLLDEPDTNTKPMQNTAKNADIIEETFSDFGIRVRVVGKSQGPAVTQYMLAIPAGTKVSKIETLTKDLTLALAAPTQIRIVAPIPGTPYIGIEVANSKPKWVSMKELLTSDAYKANNMMIPIAIGKDVAGKAIVKDLQNMPHFLVAGATGSGKSVLVNGLIISLLYKFSPDHLKLLMVDPKMVELYGYNGIPHLMTEVITDVGEVINSLKWIIEEMDRRYRLFKDAGSRNIEAYNEKRGYIELPYIIIIIDEMADLMLRHGVEVENAVVRLAQMARATGIHLILATQRPSVDVVTGLIKANIPARAAMAVTSAIDSRVILDQQGAETLLGKGDMLLKMPDSVKPTRIQGVYLKDSEIDKVLKFIKGQTSEVDYMDEITEDKEGEITKAGYSSEDEFFEDAVKIIVNSQRGSASLLQTKLSIGYARASRLIDELEQAGVVGPAKGNKPRDVLVTNADSFLESFRKGSE